MPVELGINLIFFYNKKVGKTQQIQYIKIYYYTLKFTMFKFLSKNKN